jgi:fluoroquinolone transport system permease protein
VSRCVSTVRLDLLLQLRYGFYYAAGFVTLLWIALLYSLPETIAEVAVTFVVFTDLAAVGYVFIAGTVLFEKGEKTLFALLSTPLRFREYLASKLATLTALAIVMALMVITTGYGLRFNPTLLVPGILFTSLISLLVGFISVAPFDSISEYLIPGQLPTLVLVAPLVHFFGIWESSIFYLIPTQGSLLLLGGAFGITQLFAWQIVYAVLYQLLWIAGLTLLARRVFDRYIAASGG